MNGEMKVSIIIPVYNSGSYLSKCVESVMAQTHKNLEIILIDDGSTDGSGELIDNYSVDDARVVAVHQNNAGVSAARNRGIELASGDFYHFLDSDDWMEPTAYEMLLKAAIEHSADVVVFEYYLNYPSGKEQRHSTPSKYYGSINRDLAVFMCITAVNSFSATKLYSKRCVEGQRYDETIHWGEDSMFAVAAIERALGYYSIETPLYHYVQTESSATRKRFNEKFLTGLQMTQYFLDMCEDRYPQFLTNMYCADASIVLELLFWHMDIRSTEKARMKGFRKTIRKRTRQFMFSKKIPLRQRTKFVLASVSPSLYYVVHKRTIAKYAKEAER